jgi:hypothetical protein
MEGLSKQQGFKNKSVHAKCTNGKWEFEFYGLSLDDVEKVRKEILEAYKKKKAL